MYYCRKRERDDITNYQFYLNIAVFKRDRGRRLGVGTVVCVNLYAPNSPLGTGYLVDTLS